MPRTSTGRSMKRSRAHSTIPGLALLASFGARHDERPAYLDAIAAADHVRGMMYQDGFSEDGDGWSRFRCGAGSACEGKFEWWRPENDWYDVSPTQGEVSAGARADLDGGLG